MKRNLLRTLIPIAAVVAMALLGAGSASAAGAPIVTKGGIAFGKQTLNGGLFKAKVNPNGAATTYHIEYGMKSSFLDRTTSTLSVGSGTTDVEVERNLLGVNPNSVYYTRVVASNSFGTTYSEVGQSHTALWEGQCLAKSCTSQWQMPETYKSVGTFKYTQTSAPKMTVTCNEAGYGSIGHAGGVGDEYLMNLSNCVWAEHPECKVGFYGPLQLQANFEAAGSPELLLEAEAGAGCQEFTKAIPTSPFEIAMGVHAEWKALKQLLTLTQQPQPLSSSVTITSEWSLAGPGQGSKFAWNQFYN
ncbi:MAG TPA: hypothetical protein VLK37_09270 [Solirubrobacterales bacterium]|nr:hypothetical protein [Solirubrobacterales bacterium]